MMTAFTVDTRRLWDHSLTRMLLTSATTRTIFSSEALFHSRLKAAGTVKHTYPTCTHTRQHISCENLFIFVRVENMTGSMVHLLCKHHCYFVVVLLCMKHPIQNSLTTGSYVLSNLPNEVHYMSFMEERTHVHTHSVLSTYITMFQNIFQYLSLQMVKPRLLTEGDRLPTQLSNQSLPRPLQISPLYQPALIPYMEESCHHWAVVVMMMTTGGLEILWKLPSSKPSSLMHCPV